jgi:Arc/MetJ family transcription regulator
LVYYLRGRTVVGRTNIDIDDALVEKAKRLTGARSKREAVDIALRRLVHKGSLYRALRRLRGKMVWEGDVSSWRTSRTRRG